MKIKTNESELNLNSYDLIAIDMDNTLVEYKLTNSLPLIHRLIQKYLVEEYNYPKDICEEFCPKLCQKGLIIDKINGNILKLDSSFRIISAKHGFKELTEEVIQTIYGNGEQFKSIPDLLSSGSLSAPESEFYVLKDYFTTPFAQVLAKTVEVMDKLNTSSKVNYKDISDNIYKIFCKMYGKESFKTRIGGHFAELVDNPEKYLEKSSDKLKNLLINLRKNGKLVFMITSSAVDYTKFLMEYSFGKEWINYFDFVLTFARKPTFFTTDRKFLSIDPNFDEIQSPINFEDLKFGRIYSEGNWNHLKAFVAKHCSKSSPKCVYIGDSFSDDCIVPNIYVECHTIAVVEELEEDIRPELSNTYWQSFFTDNHNNTTLWHQLIQKHSKLIISNLEDLIDFCF